MKLQIRKGLFETNSSSTHAVTIISDEDYKKYVAGDLIISRYAEFITKEEYNKLKQKAYDGCYKFVKKIWDNPNDPSYGYYHNKYNTVQEAADAEYGREYDDDMYEYDDNNMEVEHAEKEINGVKVHALSVYGYDY